MIRIIYLALMATLTLGISSVEAQRGGGRGGGGGGRGGGGFTAPARPSMPAQRPSMPAQRPSMPSPAPRPSMPSAQTARPAQPPAGGNAGIPRSPGTTNSGSGQNGGSWQSGTGGGSHTTQGGSTVTWKGAGAGGTTGGGTTGGKYVGGVQVTTPGGQTINHAGTGGAIAGPSGNGAAGRAGITGTNGPAGSGVAASRGGVATGPNGAAGYRGGVAVGPNGAAGYRNAAATSPRGTYYRSAAAATGQGAVVRAGCSNYHGCFGGAWYAKYPGAWTAARWGTYAAWGAIGWNTLSNYCGYPAESVNYDYGTSVVYQDDAVYVNGDSVGTPEQYAEQAATIAETGKKAEASKDDEWQSLGVFAMVQGEETTSNNIFQLAINKAGIIRGNYYNALTDTTEPVYGEVDKKSQRACWTVGEKKTPTYEAGIFNLSNEQTTMMVHYGKEKSQQFSLVRIERPEGETPQNPPPMPNP